jgi:molybdate transport system ATP-binding protein
LTLSVDIRHSLPGFSLDVAFEVPAGATVLFGRSGSGKTTVIKAVAGLLVPEAGRIVSGSRVLFDHAAGICIPPHRRRVGYVFQEARLFPHMSVRGNLEYGRRFAGPGGPEIDMGRIVELLGIGDLLRRRPAGLSGGETQRVAIGRALLSRPEMLLADEPLAALDAARREEILPYFERLRDELRLPILYVSHSASEVARIATTVVVLENGRVIRQGAAAEVLGDPAVTPMGARDAGALLSARVVRHHADGLTELEAGGCALLLPRLPQAVGEAVRVRIAAQDVMLARTRPEGISALNVLPGVIRQIRPGEGPGVMVALDTAAGRILARITHRSARALELTEGADAHAVIKTVSVARGDIGTDRDRDGTG